MFDIQISQMFASAHALRDYYGETEPTHGHNFRVRVTIAGEKVDKNGLLADFVLVKKSLDRIAAYLDHKFINELKPFDVVNPSAENMAIFVYEEMSKDLAGVTGEVPIRITEVRIWETDDCSAAYLP